MTPVSELPFNVRPKSRKEKNKLASRACRLKKKAQHEANKIKLYGLEIEHSEWKQYNMNVIELYILMLKSGYRAPDQWHRRTEAGAGTEASHKESGRVHRGGGSANTTHLCNGIM